MAQRKVQGMLESDAYLRFLQSDLYKELLVPQTRPFDEKPGNGSGKLSPESCL